MKRSTSSILITNIVVGILDRLIAHCASEHRAALKRMDNSSFMFKHWAVHHSDLVTAPKFVFSVSKSSQRPNV